METRVENWNGYDIRFINLDGEWYAVLKDICDALGLHTFKVSQRLDPRYLESVAVEGIYREDDIPSKYNMSESNIPLKDVHGSNGTIYRQQWMLVVNEFGIYEALFASRKLESRKFRAWTASVISQLRQSVGLKGYEIMKMTEPEIQEEIDWLLESVYWDDEKQQTMITLTVQGGDVEAIPFETYMRNK